MEPLFCYCIGNDVIYGPMPLPKYKIGTMEPLFLDGKNLSELKKEGWYPWMYPIYPKYDNTSFKLVSNRFCNGEYASEYFTIVPLTTEEYLEKYGLRLNPN